MNRAEITYKIEKFNKLDIAKKLLEKALSDYNNKEYFSALHLASAAEELLGQCLKFKNIKNSLQSGKEAFILINKKLFNKQMSDKDALAFLNKSKNAIKHINDMNDMHVYMDPVEDAETMLDRAITNCWRLEEILSPAMEQFWNRKYL